MNELIENFFNWQVLATAYPLLLKGLWMTVRLCAVVIPLGIGTGILIAVIYNFHFRVVNIFLIIYVDFFRAFPPLVLLILIYSGLPFLGLNVSPFMAVSIVLWRDHARWNRKRPFRPVAGRAINGFEFPGDHGLYRPAPGHPERRSGFDIEHHNGVTIDLDRECGRPTGVVENGQNCSGIELQSDTDHRRRGDLLRSSRTTRLAVESLGTPDDRFAVKAIRGR